MGGALGVESTLGEGSTFWVALPLVKDPRHHLPAPQGLEPPHGEAQALSSTILYIEDNLSNLRLVEQILRNWPAVRLLPAMQGGLGVELARQRHPDLVLLDLNLPDMGGAEVLTRIRSDLTTRAIPVVVLTADATAGMRERLLASGATAFLTKPFDLDQFFAVLEEILGPPARC
jgi:CheY-like chemotaxis protein